MNEAHGVNAIQCQHHLSSVKTRPLFGHVIVAHEVDQVTARHILHHHVEVAVVLECIKQLENQTHTQMNNNYTQYITFEQKVRTNSRQLIHTCTTQSLLAKAIISLSSQKKAESDLLIISNLLSSFMAYTFSVALCLTYKTQRERENL